MATEASRRPSGAPSRPADHRPHLAILGIRGVPAAHGGFETFAQRLALHLVACGWRVTVYCQEDGHGPVHADVWQGVDRIHLPSGADTARATIGFDWRCVAHAVRHRPDVALTLGYNTAAFCARLRLAGVPNVINMDGIEWQREKWSGLAKAWLYANEFLGCKLGDHLVADHPSIATHLARLADPGKITVIPYGAPEVRNAPITPVLALGLQPGEYVTLIARPEIENSVLEIVQAFSTRRRGLRLAVLGRYAPDTQPYHRAVMEAASDEVFFLGPVYDPDRVQALRFHSLLYVHGHRVGGTNPSLVEALGAGNPVMAQRNRFNSWVAGPYAAYFDGVQEATATFDRLLKDRAQLADMSRASRLRHHERFRWEPVLAVYEQLLRRHIRRTVEFREPFSTTSTTPPGPRLGAGLSLRRERLK